MWVFQDESWINGVTPEFATIVKSDMEKLYRELQKDLSFHSSYIKRLDSKCAEVNLVKVQRLIINWLSYK
jgi:RNAse (barnase) inhibitor barstar